MPAADTGIISELIERYGCDGPAIRRAVLNDEEATVEQLIAALQLETGPLRAVAIVLLGEMGDRRAVAPLMSLIQDQRRHRTFTSGPLRHRISWFLSPYLRRLERDIARSERVIVRRNAANALARLGDRRAIRALEAVQHDPDEGVRQAVQEALTRLGAGGSGAETTI